MLYEKTMNRKILGAKQQPKEEQATTSGTIGETDQHTNGDAITSSNGSVDDSKSWRKSSQTFLRRLSDSVRSIVSRKAKQSTVEDKEPASTGKILNIMR
jgi:hypothetical protein